MPYTDTRDRHPEWLPNIPETAIELGEVLAQWLEVGRFTHLGNSGDDTWAVCFLVGAWCVKNGRSYQTWFDALWALQYARESVHSTGARTVLNSAEHEFYRRVVAPYEELKRLANGEVWPRSILPLDGQYD